MLSPRTILAGLLLAAIGGILVFAWKGSQAEAPSAFKKVKKPGVVEDADDLAAASGVSLSRATSEARKLGIARSSFGSTKEDPKEAPEVELSREERKLLDKFKNGNLSRIGNATVFASPDASTMPAPDPAVETGGGR